MTFAEAISYLSIQAEELTNPQKSTLLTGLSEVDAENVQLVRDAGVVKINSVVEAIYSDPEAEGFDAADVIAENVDPQNPNYPTRPH